MENIMYRSEDSYGSGVRDILDIMTFEIYELKNIDILEYTLEHYLQNSNIEETVENMIADIEIFNEEEVYKVCKLIINEINKQTDHNLKYALWLAEYDAVSNMYSFDESSIEAYNTSDIILSDLGYDGILFGYDEEPEPIER